MQFSIASVAFLATAVLAGEYSTVYTTEEVTITSCASTVTNCPAKSTVVSTTSYPVVVTSVPTYSNTSATSAPYVVVPPSSSVSVPVYVTKSSAGVVVPTYSASLSTITISTCVPTVIYKTVTVAPSASKPAASSTGTISYYHNATAPAATATPSTYVTGSASSIQGSIVAVFAAVAAFAVLA